MSITIFNDVREELLLFLAQKFILAVKACTSLVPRLHKGTRKVSLVHTVHTCSELIGTSVIDDSTAIRVI